MRARIASMFVLLAACADPPTPAVTHQAAGHTVFARQYDQCLASLRGLRDTRNRDDARVTDLQSARDQAEATFAAATGLGTDPARAALQTAEAALAAARARYEEDRDAIRRREDECTALHDRMRELR